MGEVFISESAEVAVRAAAASKHPTETGGILIGAYAGGRPWITLAVEVPPEDPRPDHYVLPAGVTHRLVLLARRDDPRLGYLGEWHVHPADVGPSRTDRATMRRLSRRTKSRPVLLLVRKGFAVHRLEAYQWYGRRQRQRTIVRTGEPPPVAPGRGLI